MQYVCNAPGGKTWFRIESGEEALLEQDALKNSVDVQFENARRTAVQKYQPAPRLHHFERDIGLKAHLMRTMPMFLTLRDREGAPLANAMLPPCGRDDGSYACKIVGPGGSDALSSHPDAAEALATHFGLSIREQVAEHHFCYPPIFA